jgi:hypothetical protein
MRHQQVAFLDNDDFQRLPRRLPVSGSKNLLDHAPFHICSSSRP